MPAIVFEEDPHSRKVLGKLLKKLGYARVLEASQLDEFDFFCKQNGNKIELILSGDQNERGLDQPISRLILKNKDLSLAPLIFMNDRGFKFTLNFNDSRHSRIDSYLSRPFGIEALRRAIDAAHERRANLRNVLLICGSENPEAIEATYREDNHSHWKETVFLSSLKDLKEKWTHYGFKVGGILFDSEHCKNNEEIESWLNQVKKEALGSSTLFGVLGRDPAKIQNFRNQADLFFDSDLEWTLILDQLSHQFLHDWEASSLAKRLKEKLKARNLSGTERLLKNVSQNTLDNIQIREIMGLHAQLSHRPKLAIQYYQKALELNPCSPSLYLQLVKLVHESEKKEWIKQATLYCPQHPQIKELSAGAQS